MSAGNQEFLYLPARATIQATEAISAYLDLYFLIPFDQFNQIYRLGVNLGMGYAITNRIDVGPELRLPALVSGRLYDASNGGDGGGFNVRQLGGFANFRF